MASLENAVANRKAQAGDGEDGRRFRHRHRHELNVKGVVDQIVRGGHAVHGAEQTVDRVTGQQRESRVRVEGAVQVEHAGGAQREQPQDVNLVSDCGRAVKVVSAVDGEIAAEV